MNVIEEFLPVVLFIMLHKLFINFSSIILRLVLFKEYYKIWLWTEVKMVYILTKNSPCSTNNRQRYCQSYAKRSPHKWGSFIQEPNIRLDNYVSLYICMGYWPSVRSRWLDIGQVFFCVCLWTESKLRSINTHKKRTRSISSHLDRTSLVNN